jgi:protein-tyrosine phosphatase
MVRVMKLPFGLVSRKIYGGPYREKPEDFVGIKCAAEIKDYAAMSVSIRDFGVPLRPEQMEHAIAFALTRLAEGMPIYVGCMGGLGRTGLFLACLVKALGVEKPIEYVREHYIEHAVERPEQEKWIEDFDVSQLRADAERAKIKAFWYSFFRFWTFGLYPRPA